MIATAYGIFLVNFLFGLAVGLGIVDSSRFRFVHHAIYFLVMLSLIVATALSIGRGESIAWAFGTMAALLLVMPRFPGRSRGHALYAVVCLVLYSAIVFLG
jgi:hypothetical protein